MAVLQLAIQYILNTFLSLGIPVKPVIIKLLPHYNDHDTKWAFDFCEAKNLSPIIIDIDFDKFVNTGKLFDYGAKYKTSAYYYCPLMHAIGQLSGTVIVGLGESHLVKNTENNKWYNSWDEYEYSVVNFFHENNITGTCQFGSWSEGQFFSYATDPILTELSLNKIVGKLGSNSSKHHIYNRNAVQPLQVRPKYHGYEIIEQSEIFKHPSFTDIKTVNKQNDGVYQLEYFEFLDIYKSIQVGTDV